MELAQARHAAMALTEENEQLTRDRREGMRELVRSGGQRVERREGMSDAIAPRCHPFGVSFHSSPP